jgi:ribosomal protein L31E
MWLWKYKGKRNRKRGNHKKKLRLKMVNNVFRHIVIVIICLFCGAGMGYAQVQVTQTIDSLQILIGEQTNLTLSVNMPKGQHAELPAFKPSQLLTPGVEVVEWKDVDTTDLDHDMIQVKRIYTLTSFDENVYSIPALKVKVGGQYFQGNPLALKVLTVAVDTVHINQYYPPKDVQNNPFDWGEWSCIFWMSVLLVLLCAAMVYLYVRLSQNKPIITHLRIVKRIPAHEKALKAINEIKTHHVENQESQKEYYTRLTDTLREYIVSRFGFNAMEMTSTEIIARLQESGDQKSIDELKGLFLTADLVKFAKYETLINENDMNLVNAVKFIDETKTNEQPMEERIVPKLSETDKKTRKTRSTIKVVLVVLCAVGITLLIYIMYNIVMLLS